MGTLSAKCLLFTLALSSGLWRPGAAELPDYQPQQVHIAIGETNDEMVISWVTMDYTPSSIVEFGTDALKTRVESFPKNFTNLGFELRVMFMHKVTITNLLPDTRYFYHCGSEYGWSDLFTFKTWKSGTDWPVKIAMYGDLGSENAQSLPRLQTEVQNGMYDAIIHVGDFAYDMQNDNGRVGDEFMRQIQPIATLLPYMTVPGNHEMDFLEFRNYRHRFHMPKNTNNSWSLYYSWNMGPVHFIGVNTELYYLFTYFFGRLQNQYEWLENDLKEATKPENRAERPWIILYGHRPMYCSTVCQDDCYNVDCRTRVGYPYLNLPGLEDLLYDYGVDLAVWAHEHSYERLWPLYNYTVVNGSMEEPYTNPPVPVHFTTGSAGCKERIDDFVYPQPDWSAFRIADYGYTRLTVHNKTHLYWEQVSDDKAGDIQDSIWLVKDKHVPYKELWEEWKKSNPSSL
ncbi:acid phosphatase type 7-like [Macrobrachium rosenbergii]